MEKSASRKGARGEEFLAVQDANGSRNDIGGRMMVGSTAERAYTVSSGSTRGGTAPEGSTAFANLQHPAKVQYQPTRPR